MQGNAFLDLDILCISLSFKHRPHLCRVSCIARGVCNDQAHHINKSLLFDYYSPLITVEFEYQ